MKTVLLVSASDSHLVDIIHPGIDLVFYGQEGQLEYDFVVAPGADPHEVAMALSGVTEALVDRRVIQSTLLRSTIHMVSAADWPLFAAGTRNARREWWLRASRGQSGTIDMIGFTKRAMSAMAFEYSS